MRTGDAIEQKQAISLIAANAHRLHRIPQPRNTEVINGDQECPAKVLFWVHDASGARSCSLEIHSPQARKGWGSGLGLGFG